MSKKSIQRLKYLENEKSFWAEIKMIFFIIFKAFSVAKNCLRPESLSLRWICVGCKDIVGNGGNT